MFLNTKRTKQCNVSKLNHNNNHNITLQLETLSTISYAFIKEDNAKSVL